MNEKQHKDIDRTYQRKRPSPKIFRICNQYILIRNQIFSILIILMVFIMVAVPGSCFGETKRLFRIGTGGLTGV